MHLKALALSLFAATALAVPGAADKADAVKRQDPPPPIDPPNSITLRPISGGLLDYTPSVRAPSTTATSASGDEEEDNTSVTSESATPTAAPTEESSEGDEGEESSATDTSTNLAALPTDAGPAYFAGAAGLLGLAAVL